MLLISIQMYFFHKDQVHLKVISKEQNPTYFYMNISEAFATVWDDTQVCLS